MINMFILLMLAHFLCDYALQGDFMAKAKNHKAPIPGVPWLTVLTSHAAIHAGFVVIITGSVAFGVIELIVHSVTDYLKCDGRLNFNQDQAIHLATKVGFVVAMGSL